MSNFWDIALVRTDKKWQKCVLSSPKWKCSLKLSLDSFFIRPNPWGRIMAHRFSVWFSSIDLKKLNVFQTYRRINQWRKSLYVSGWSSPIFSLLICSNPYQIWQVCSLVHNLEDFFYFFEILTFINFFVFLGLGQFLRWNTDHVQIEFLWVSWGKWPILKLF